MLHRKKSKTPLSQIIRAALSFVVLIALCLNILSLPSIATEQPEKVPEQAAITERLDEQLELSISFTDSFGKTAAVSDFLLLDRPSIIVPVYYHCAQLCSHTLNGVLDVVNQMELTLGSDYNVIVVSFDHRETIDQAQQKAAVIESAIKQRHGTTPGWHFLIGSKENISTLMTQLGFSFKEDGPEYIHAAMFAVLTPQGRISRYFYGIKFRAPDVQLALVEAARGKIGSTLERVFLYCFHFDPLRGKYTLASMNIMRVGCLGVLGGLVLMLIILRIKE